MGEQAQKKRKIAIKSAARHKKVDYKWVATIIAWTFAISFLLSLAFSSVQNFINIYAATALLLFIVLLGVLFDMVGIAVTAANEQPFHSMAARKISAAKDAIKLIRNSEKVSNFCNDVVGDISGIISGTLTVAIALLLRREIFAQGAFYIEPIFVALIVSITVGGKAIGKTIAISNSNMIIYAAAFCIRYTLGLLPNKKTEDK